MERNRLGRSWLSRSLSRFQNADFSRRIGCLRRIRSLRSGLHERFWMRTFDVSLQVLHLGEQFWIVIVAVVFGGLNFRQHFADRINHGE